MTRKIENIEQFNRFFGQPTYHSQVSVCNLADADPLVYLHGGYYGLGKKIGKFGWSVEKKKK